MNHDSPQLAEAVRKAVAQRRQFLARSSPSAPPSEPVRGSSAHPAPEASRPLRHSNPGLPPVLPTLVFPAAYPSDGPFEHLVEAERLLASAESKNDRSAAWGPLAYWLGGSAAVRERSLAATQALFAQIWQLGKRCERWFEQAEQAAGLGGPAPALCDYAGLKDAEEHLRNALRKAQSLLKDRFPQTLFRRHHLRLFRVDAAATRHAFVAAGELARQFSERHGRLARHLALTFGDQPVLLRASLREEVLGLLGGVDHALAAGENAPTWAAGFRSPQGQLNRRLLDAKKVFARSWGDDLRSLRPAFAAVERGLSSHLQERQTALLREAFAERDHFVLQHDQLLLQAQGERAERAEIERSLTQLWQQERERWREEAETQRREDLERFERRATVAEGEGQRLAQNHAENRQQVQARLERLDKALTTVAARLDPLREEASRQLQGLGDELAAQLAPLRELPDRLEAQQRELEAARAAIESVRQELSAGLSTFRSDLEATRSELPRLDSLQQALDRLATQEQKLKEGLEDLQNLPHETRLLFHRLGQFEASLPPARR